MSSISFAAYGEESTINNNNNREDGGAGHAHDAVSPVTNFDDMNLPENLLRGIYGHGFESPSVIQQRAIVPLGKGFDLIAQSQSGTGKTAAFGVGLLQRIDTSSKDVQAMVLEPSRELAGQNADVIRSLGSHMSVGVHTCVGGVSLARDRDSLRQGCQVVVGTPGRILDLIGRGVLDLRSLKMLIMDEADEMLSAGFLDQIKDILSQVPENTQIGLFSATLPPDTLEITEKFMQDPLKIIVTRDQLALQGINQYYVFVEQERNKFATLIDLYDSISLAQSVIS